MALTAVQLTGSTWSESDLFGQYVAALYSPSTPSWGRKIIGTMNANGYTLAGGESQAADITTSLSYKSESFEGMEDSVVAAIKSALSTLITPAKARELSGLEFKVQQGYEELNMVLDKTIGGAQNPGWIIDELNPAQPNVYAIDADIASYIDETWLDSDVPINDVAPLMVQTFNNFLGYQFVGGGEPIAMPAIAEVHPQVIFYL